jgi:phage regulator Rha-like protein
MTKEKKALLPQERIENKIYLIRGEKVMLDRDLAELYGVETKVFNQAVKRNKNRFPNEFMFQLTKIEADSLRSRSVTLKRGEHRKYLPYAFTEYGVAMLSGVLNSDRAIQVNIQIIRTFIKIRRLLASHRAILKRLDQFEAGQAQQDEQIVRIFEVIQRILDLPLTLRRKPGRIGFVPLEKGSDRDPLR